MTPISKVVLAAALAGAVSHPALGQVCGEYVVSSNSQVTDSLRPEIRFPVEQPKTVDIEVPDEKEKKPTPWEHIKRYFHDTYRGGRWLVIKAKPFVEFGANAADIYRGIRGYN